MYGCLETEVMGYVREWLHDVLGDKLSFVFFRASLHVVLGDGRSCGIKKHIVARRLRQWSILLNKEPHCCMMSRQWVMLRYFLRS